jgi:hypothetical protein
LFWWLKLDGLFIANCYVASISTVDAQSKVIRTLCNLAFPATVAVAVTVAVAETAQMDVAERRSGD